MADIRYRFIATGQGEVANAFKGITASARESQKATEAARASMQKTSKERASGGGRPRNETEALARKVAQDQERAGKKAASEVAKHEAKLAADGHRRAQAYQRVLQRDAAKATRDDAKAREHVFQIRARHHQAEERREQQAMARRQAMQVRAAQKVSDGRMATLGRIGSGAASLLLGGATAAGAAGAGLVGAAARDSMKLGETANRISISAREAGGAYVDPQTLRKEFEDTAMATPGVQSQDVADAVAKFVSLTGDLDTARKSVKTFATVASATGAEVGDVAEAAASLSQQFGIKSEAQMQQTLAALTYQGKGGAFELKDAAGLFQRLAAAGAGFGIQQNAQGVRTLGGLTQVARGGTGSSEQAATAVENILTQLKVKSGLLKDEGVNVYGKDGKTRDLKDVLVDSIANVGGSSMEEKNAKLSKLFGEQGIKGLNPLIATFSKTLDTTKGSESVKMAAATKAVREQLEKAIDAPGTFADVQMDAARAQQDTSARLTQAWEMLKGAVSERLTPMIVAAAGKLLDFATKTDAIDGLVTIFVALGEAAGLVIDAFTFLGLIKPKTAAEPKPYQEQLTAKKAALAKFEEDNATAMWTPEYQARKDSMELEVGMLDALAYQSGNKPLSDEEYSKQYRAAGASSTAAQDLAYYSGGWMWGTENTKLETDAQRELRTQQETLGGAGFQLQQRRDANSAITNQNVGLPASMRGGGLSADEVSKALADVTREAQAAAAALQKIKSEAQASVVTGQ